MQAISIEVQLQYRGTRARLLYQADQRGDSSSLLSRFVMGDFRDLSLMFMGPVKSVDLFQNGCRASWSILSPSVSVPLRCFNQTKAAATNSNSFNFIGGSVYIGYLDWYTRQPHTYPYAGTRDVCVPKSLTIHTH